MSRYKDFIIHSIPAVNGDQINLMIIPKGDSLENMMEVTHALGYIGQPEESDQPPNSVIVRPELFSLEDADGRVFEIACEASIRLINNKEGLFYVRTRGGMSIEQIKNCIESLN